MTDLRSLTPEDKAFVDALIRVGLCLLVVGQAAAGYTDSDIWGHMSIGLDMLRDRHFLWVDPYSFTHDQAWINHEWLWDLLTAGTYALGGLSALVAFRAGLAAIVLWAVDRSTRTAPSMVRLVTLGLVALGCAGQWRSTRPQMATLALYAVLLMALGRSRRPTTDGQRPLPWWLPVLFLVWANLHGGWAFGLAAVVAYAVTHPSRRPAILTLTSAAATLINPYGFRLWLAIGDATARGWSDLAEWQPVWRLGAGKDALVLWMLVAAAVVWMLTRTRRDGWTWGWTMISLAAAANSRRLTALAALTAALLLVPSWKAAEEQVSVAWTAHRRRVFGAVVAVAGAVAFLLLLPSLSCFPPMPEWTNAPESDSVAFLRSVEVRRLVPHFDFGEYAIFHLRDRMQVASDNRRETVYSDRVVQENQRFTDGLDPEYPERIGADAVWWPANQTRVIVGLEQRGWVRRFEGPRTVVLLKAPGPLSRTGQAWPRTPCFPNP